MADNYQHRSFCFEAIARGGDHFTVQVRAGKDDHSRALLGHLTLGAWEWSVLQQILVRGSAAAEAWGSPSVEVVDYHEPVVPSGDDG